MLKFSYITLIITKRIMKEKDFDKWNEQKKNIHFNSKNKFYKSREIWWCNLGINVGFEQNGESGNNERPVLIVKGLSKHTCFVIPLTTSTKKHFMRIYLGEIDEKESSAIISQAKVIDTKRLINRISILNKNKFREIRKAVKDLL